MPIKLPKGFQRRKSSGNVLDEVSNPPQSTFRVFERQADASKSFEGLHNGSRTGDSRPLSEGQERGFDNSRPPMNRGSGGTQNSASSGGMYDTSSSARYSSSSTLPSSSSFEVSNDEYSHGHPKRPQKAALPSAPNAPTGFSLRAAGRTFSFGPRKAAQQLPQQQTSPDEAVVPQIPQQHADYTDIPDVRHAMRQRAMTETSHASGSTATPPKLLDTDLNFGGADDDDGFRNMFASMDPEKRLSRNLADSGFSGATGSAPSLSSTRPDLAPIATLRLDRSQQMSPSPFSPASQSSGDRLITASPMSEDEMFHRGPSANGAATQSIPSRLPPDLPPYREPTQDSFRQRTQQQHLARPQAPNHGEPSPPLIDEDMRLAMRYMGHDKALKPPPKRKSLPSVPRKSVAQSAPQRPPQRAPLSSDSDRRPITLYDGGNQDHLASESGRNDSITTTPKAKLATMARPDDGMVDDLDFQEMARSADLFQSGKVSQSLQRATPVNKGKIMTPAQFEQYKKDQESWRNGLDAKSDSEDGDGDDDEEDEEERNREMARQRRRQEAQLSVYRQTMMKVTGEPQPLNPSQRPASQSVPNLLLQAPAKSHDSKESSDEDEDIPLGILAAHGFPSKERPPSHLNRMGSQPNIRYASETYPPPPASIAGTSNTAGARGSALPPFARNLPRDPYYGASIVNPANRESLAMGSGASSYGTSQAMASAPHPGGLVGVIAKEERARAMRRGSPNAATYESANAIPLAPGMGGPGSAGYSATDQQASAQQMQQMTQMMQMQMQWMQQMMAMHGQPMPNGMAPMPGMPGMPGMPQQMQGMPYPGMMPPTGGRPSSQGSPSVPHIGPLRPPSQLGVGPANSGRAMSMLAPEFAPNWNNGRAGGASSRLSVLAPPSTSGRMSALSQNLGGGPNLGPGNGYAPSLAPSERSTIGMPSRYRPVSIAPADEMGASMNRASTMGSATLGQWEGGQPQQQSKGKAAVTIRTGPAAGGGKGASNDEEDDDEGWAEMQRKRESKRNQWRGKRQPGSRNALEGVFYPGMD